MEEAPGGGLDLAAHHLVFVDQQGDLHRLSLGGVVGELIGVPLHPPAPVLVEVKALVRLELKVVLVAVVELLRDQQLFGGAGGTPASPGR